MHAYANIYTHNHSNLFSFSQFLFVGTAIEDKSRMAAADIFKLTFLSLAKHKSNIPWIISNIHNDKILQAHARTSTFQSTLITNYWLHT